MIRSLLVFTESSPAIGLGHLVECQSIVHEWTEQHGLQNHLFYVFGDGGAETFLRSRGMRFQLVENGFIPSADELGIFDAVLVNKKYVEIGFLNSLRLRAKKLIVIDELGGRAISADYLINFSINTRRHQYEFPDGPPRMFFGPQYFPAQRAVIDALRQEKPLNSDTVTVSLGGYDYSGNTGKVLEVLRPMSHLRKEVILGPGFTRDAAFERMARSFDGSCLFLGNVDDLPQRIRRSRFLVSSGGNTLYEAAILGTPALVLGEEPHEVEQGRIFEEMGCAINLERGKDASHEEIKEAIGRISMMPVSDDCRIHLTPWYAMVAD